MTFGRSKRRKVKKIWAISQMNADLGRGSLFFPSYVDFSNIF